MTVATWNVRSMLQPGKMIEIANEGKKFGINIMALQEIRWMGKGKIDKKDFSMYYSGPESRTGLYGTGFIIDAHTRKSFIGFKPVNDRICKIRLKGHFRNISIISAYAPTEESREEDKEKFYDDLYRECERVQKYDLLIVLGDFNAKIGTEDFVKQVAGKYTLHDETNENGKLLSHFATAQNLIIQSTCFSHKRIHKGTWKAPGSNIVNQIDHILVSRRHRSSVIDVRSARGPNCDSDHYMVKMIIRERISKIVNRCENKRIKWNIDKLKEESHRKIYQETLENKLKKQTNIAQDNNDSRDLVNNGWNTIKQAIIETTKESIGEKTRSRNEQWFDGECREAINQKNKDRLHMLQRETRIACDKYKESRRIANKIIRKKKKMFLKNEIELVEALHSQNENRKFYQAVKKMNKGFTPCLQICKDGNGNIISDRQEVIERWTEYFEKITRRNDLITERMEYATAEPEIEIPDEIDIEIAIGKQRSNRAPGEDTLNIELFKNGGEKLIKELHILIVNIWENERMPDEWYNGLICPIFKKGDRMECQNYRGITLLNTAYKVLSNIIQHRLNKFAENVLEEYQCGFREGRSTTEQIFVMRQLMEKCSEYNVALHILFVDFRQAFDSVDRINLYNSMEEFGIPKKLVRLVNMTLEDTKGKVLVGGGISKSFGVQKGVRQGDGLSAVLFNLALNKVLKEMQLNGNILFKSKQACVYADDIALVARNIPALEEMLNIIEEVGRKVGLTINTDKTKYMRTKTSQNRDIPRIMKIGNYNFESVNDFTYLGVQLNSRGTISEEINYRIIQANKAYFANLKLLKSSLLTKSTKLKIYQTLIRPIVSYAAETWTLHMKDENALRIFERKIIRRVYGPVNQQGIWRIRTNSEINDILKGEDIVRHIKSMRLRWIGHVERMEEERMPKRLMKGEIIGPRKRGRPRRRWIQDVEQDLKKMKIRKWKELVQQRDIWKEVVKEAKAHQGL